MKEVQVARGVGGPGQGLEQQEALSDPQTAFPTPSPKTQDIYFKTKLQHESAFKSFNENNNKIQGHLNELTKKNQQYQENIEKTKKEIQETDNNENEIFQSPGQQVEPKQSMPSNIDPDESQNPGDLDSTGYKG